LLTAVPLLLAVSAFTFLLLRVIPGDPILAMMGERYDPETVAALRAQLGLDAPWPEQMLRFFGDLARGDLGVSLSLARRPVADLIFARLPHTLLLASGAIAIAVATGLLLGALAAHRPGSWLDRGVTTLSLVGVSVPVFTTGLFLAFLLGVLWKIFPPSGSDGWDLRFLALPALTLSTQSTALVARITRASLLDVAGRDFVRTAHAKGAGRLRVFFVHLLRNAAIPIVTVIGTDFGSYLGGSVLTESVFAWPGVGRLTLEAISQRDFPLIQGIVIVMAAIFIVVNLTVDCLYAALNPRVGAR
jgi:peptide/nickel transport system permease protein/oligopeptide transport system permease protein